MGESRVYWCCSGCRREGVETGDDFAGAEESCIAAHDDAAPACPAWPIMTVMTREREGMALDALIISALRAPDYDPDPATPPELTAEERAAIDEHLGPDLIGRLLADADDLRERLAETGRGPGLVDGAMRADDALDGLVAVAIESAAVREMLAQERGDA